MSGTSSISSSIYSVLTDYYASRLSTEIADISTDETSADTTEVSEILGQEEITEIYFSLTQGLVDVLSSMPGTDTDDDSDDDWFYEALGVRNNANSISDMLLAYYTTSYTDTSTGSGIDITA